MRDDGKHDGSPNRLLRENSPYLIQHARNPVDWYPWGEEAFKKARRESKPIFLSIGYAACHWCHVMERESFENQDIAALLNRDFVSIKVDREERPEVDEIYMRAVQMMTGSGGWPLTVFLTPDLKPFYGGTYFPPEERYGRPGFRQVLKTIAAAWQNDRAQVDGTAGRLTELLRRVPRAAEGSPEADGRALQVAARALGERFDADWGGFGGAPKFPGAGDLALLMRVHRQTGDPGALAQVLTTLDRMAAGGIYDQLGGGFHRYAVDREWLVPHFEKMLYDNALLSQVYLEAYQLTGNDRYRQVVDGILGYVLRDLRDEGGGFHASEDADSEGEEGKFYVWNPAEIREVLGSADATLFMRYYGVTEGGNFEDENVLHRPVTTQAFCRSAGLEESAWQARITEMRTRMLEARRKRIRPGKDDKVLASWNGMMVSSLCRAAQVLGNERYAQAAQEAGHFLVATMMVEGELTHVYRQGKTQFPGGLEDYALVANAMVDLYETTFDALWLRQSDSLARVMIGRFSDAAGAGFFKTADDHNYLVARTKTFWDSSVPSGNASAALMLLRLARLRGDAAMETKAREMIDEAVSIMAGQLQAVSHMLVALDFALHGDGEIVVAGAAGADDTARILAAVREPFLPNKVVAFIDPSSGHASQSAEYVPLLQDRGMLRGKAVLYVCQGQSCRKPMTDLAEIGRFMAQSGAVSGP